MNCLILMTSYNGEKYIEKQIESIRCQSSENWQLLIRDDGSKDRTIEIIHAFMQADDRIKLIQNDSMRYGPYLNFWSLIKYAKNLPQYDYYFFSDQDDIWLPDKLEKMTAAIDDKRDIPVLAYADMEVIDESDKLVYKSLDEIIGISEKGIYLEFFVHGYVSGCAAVINRKLFESVPVYPLDRKSVNIMSHDNYFTKFAIATGEVVWLDFPVIQYRRHSENVTLGNKYKLNAAKILEKAAGVFGELAKTHGRVYAQTLLTIEQMRKAGIKSLDVDSIEKGIKAGGLRGIKVLKKYDVHRKQKSRTIGLYAVMLFGTYKKYMKEFMEM